MTNDQSLCREHKVELRKDSELNIEIRHKDEFVSWFRKRVSRISQVLCYYVICLGCIIVSIIMCR